MHTQLKKVAETNLGACKTRAKEQHGWHTHKRLNQRRAAAPQCGTTRTHRRFQGKECLVHVRRVHCCVSVPMVADRRACARVAHAVCFACGAMHVPLWFVRRRQRRAVAWCTCTVESSTLLLVSGTSIGANVDQPQRPSSVGSPRSEEIQASNRNWNMTILIAAMHRSQLDEFTE